MTTASLRRRLPLSKAVPPLEDDDLLAEILLRLPPLPSSLPRASAVCTRWRGLLSDPAFHRRFRTHHRRSPPLIGFIELINISEGITFHPALDGPDRLPRGSFNLNTDGLGVRIRILGCRHGLGLLFVRVPCQLLVWDPVAGDLHRLDVPPEFKLHYHPLEDPISGAVLRAADHFQVVLVGSSCKQQSRRALACVYSSETGAWGDLVSTPFPSKATIFDHEPAVLAGDCLHWQILTASRNIILEFDLNTRSLAVTSLSKHMLTRQHYGVIRAEGGRMGFIFVSGFTAQLWRKDTDCDSWVRGRTIQLDKLLPPDPQKEYPSMVGLLGYAEESNVVFFETAARVFMLHLESLQLKRLSEVNNVRCHHPFELVYTPGNIMPLNFALACLLKFARVL
ncbi:uncharacterized protein LOC124689578 [Lolium rigidum]|uniref:uncharacterized protein LOC124689578 n=1 Tax=Lolium rigidum TaxID=89674 RepID=UPI001F5DBD09|nr:uncharacterized protein LOC124689578 [Lolium rigidum]